MKAISVVVIWWIFWLIIANFSLTGLDTPSFEAQLYPILFLATFIIGYLLFPSKYFNNSLNDLSRYKLYGYREDEYYLKSMALMGYVLIPIVLFVLSKSIFNILTEGIDGYRLRIFQSAEDGGTIFSSDSFQLLYLLIIKPIISVYTVLAIWAYVRYEKNKYLILGFLVGGLDSVSNFGRFFFYEYVFYLFLLVFIIEKKLLCNLKSDNIKTKKLKLFSFPIIASVFLIIFAFILRMENEDMLINFIKTELIDYHTIGFLFFDKELSNPYSLSNSNIYLGQSSFSAFCRYFELISHQIIPGHTYPELYELINERQNFVSLSYSGVNENSYNAFYTILTTLYMDGRIVGIIIGGLILGILLKYNYLKLLFRASPFNFLCILLIMRCLIFSIFQSRIEELIVLLMCILLVDGIKKLLYQEANKS